MLNSFFVSVVIYFSTTVNFFFIINVMCAVGVFREAAADRLQYAWVLLEERPV